MRQPTAPAGSDAWSSAAMAVMLPPTSPLLRIPASLQWARLARPGAWHVGVPALLLFLAVLAGAFYGFLATP